MNDADQPTDATTTAPAKRKHDLNKLAGRLIDAYLEECASGECRCVTIRGHEANLALGRKLAEEKRSSG